MTYIKYLIAIFIAAFFLTSCQTNKGISKKNSIPETEPVSNATSKTGKTKEPEPRIVSASFVAVGDNLIHLPIYKQAETRAKTSDSETTAKNSPNYIFSNAYKELLPFVNNADFAFINQETLVAPSLNHLHIQDFAQEKWAIYSRIRFNMISIANNHMLIKTKQG